MRRPDWLTLETKLVEYLLQNSAAAPVYAAAAEGGKGPVSEQGGRRGGSGGRVVSGMEGINHYWRTPSFPDAP